MREDPDGARTANAVGARAVNYIQISGVISTRAAVRELHI
eukprot:COSAG02_NODE_40820_length_401_cov_0.834437_2_plen_39_part_01